MKWMRSVVAAAVMAFGLVLVVPQVAGAASVGDDPVVDNSCVETSIPILKGTSKCVENNPATGGAVVTYLRLALTLVNGLVGAVIMIMLVIAGLGYITANGDAGQIKSAKNRIVNSMIALVLYVMMAAILNFIVPGGIL